MIRLTAFHLVCFSCDYTLSFFLWLSFFFFLNISITVFVNLLSVLVFFLPDYNPNHYRSINYCEFYSFMSFVFAVIIVWAHLKPLIKLLRNMSFQLMHVTFLIPGLLSLFFSYLSFILQVIFLPILTMFFSLFYFFLVTPTTCRKRHRWVL